MSDPKKCSICLKSHKVMVSLHEVLGECEKLTVAQVLEHLQFFTNTNAASRLQTLCFICVTKIKCCFDLKKSWGQIENKLKMQTENMSESGMTTSLPIVETIQEEKLAEEDNICMEIAFENYHLVDNNQFPVLNSRIRPDQSSGTRTGGARQNCDNGIAKDRMRSSSQDHRSIGGGASKRDLVCPICRKKFRFNMSLNKHMEKHCREN